MIFIYWGDNMLNQRIRELRISHNLNQVQLAKQLSVTKQSISNWENDNIQPSVEMLIKLADFFSVRTDYLLGREDARYLDVSALSEMEAAHVQQIIHDLAAHRSAD